jgi:phenylalanyl-tRNA synthetase beta chain
MKISVNWLREFTNIKLPIDELITRIGAQLGEVEEVIDYGKQYEGVVVVKVVACDPHPNADKLQICKIDDGGMVKKVQRDDKGLVQVVCGAPNVRKGLTVAWIPPGAIVPSTYDNEQFTLEVRPLRGIDSNGMLASAKELNIGDDHDGILVVDKPAKPGTSFAELYELDDYIIDIENKMFTHRPDCFGILGVAREIAGIQGVQFKSPDWYLNSLPLKAGKAQKTIPLKVKNGIPKLVPRFTALALSDVKVTKSPVIMRTYLSRVGLKSINNVVDITNFVMFLTAQPLHAYDADKLPKPSLETRMSKKGDKLALLNGKSITLNNDKTMLITSDDEPVGVAGIMGGRDTEVDFSTENIILECATFDMYAVRKVSMALGLFTDALTRFNKGQSPLQNDVVLTYATGMLQKLAHAELASDVIDTAPDKSVGFWKGIHVGQDFINDRLGLELTTAQITKLLKNVEMGVTANSKNLIVSPPFWRTDLEIPEDIVEEVGRLHGYDNLPLTLPKRDLTPVPKDELLEVKSKVRNVLAKAGANEVLTYTFVHGDLLQKVGQDEKQAYEVSNALSPDLQYYRLSLTPSLLDKVHMNIKAGFNEFALFEINKTHNKLMLDDEKLPFEFNNLSLVYASRQTKKSAAYYEAKRQLDYLLDAFGVQGIQLVPLEKADIYGNKVLAQMSKPFDPKRTAALVDTEKLIWGFVGEYRSAVRKSLKLPTQSAGFEIDPLIFLNRVGGRQYKPLSRFPSTHQDISFKVKADVSYTEIESVVCTALETAAQEHGYETQLSPTDIYKKEKAAKHYTFRITLSHPDRTLVTEEVNALLDGIAVAAKKAVQAIRL